MDKSDRHGNTQLAFDVAAEHLNIPKLLDVEDVCDISKPDERSIMTYVAQYFHAFSELGKVDTAGRRVAKFAEVMESVWSMENDYERRVKAVRLICTMSFLLICAMIQVTFESTHIFLALM